MPTTPIGGPIKHDDALTPLADFKQSIAPAIYQESIAFSLSVLKRYILDAETELKRLRPKNEEDYCIVIMPIVDNSGTSSKLTALLTPAFYVDKPTQNGSFKHQFTQDLYGKSAFTDPENPYDPYDPANPPIDALNHGQGAPFM